MLRDSLIDIQVRAMPDQLVQALESAIVFGELQAGTHVVEEEVAERYRVSRSPVREALRRLERDGMLVRDERRGVRVAPISRRDLDEIYMCRIPLEGLAAAQAAAMHHSEVIPRLNLCLTDLERCFNSGDIKGYFIANVAFTDLVHSAAANATLAGLLEGIGKRALRYRYFAYSTAPDLVSASVEGSREIVDMISDRNQSGAKRVTEKLIERSWKTIRNLIDA